MTDPVPPRPYVIGSGEAYVDKHAVAEFLGLSTSWVEKQSSNPSFPSHKVGAVRRYRLSEIERAVNDGTIERS